MKTPALLLAVLCSGTAWAVSPVIEIPKNLDPGASAPAARPAPASLSLNFVKVPLGNVTRILSARFNVQVSIATNARAPITGDFSRLALQPALAEAARQAGLVVTPLGSDPSAGFSLALPEPKKAPSAALSTEAGPPAQSQLDAAARQRADLLRKRASLLERSTPADPES